MTDRGVELQLGEIAGQNKMILRELDLATDSRADQARSINEIKSSVGNINETAGKLDGRVAVVEDFIINARPTIDEFVDLKKKVIGAGKLGKWLWTAVAALIGIIFAVRTELFGWLGPK